MARKTSKADTEEKVVKKKVSHEVKKEPKEAKAKKEVKEKPEVVVVEKELVEKSLEVEKPKATKPAVKKIVKKAAIVSHGVGRRKSAVARVWLLHGSGSIMVNGRDYQSYFDTQQMRLDAEEPFRVIPQAKNFDVKAIIVGGGKAGQAAALKVGIARSLSSHDSQLRPQLRKFGLLTVDSRVKERKKPGRKAARKRFQFVKR